MAAKPEETSNPGATNTGSRQSLSPRKGGGKPPTSPAGSRHHRGCGRAESGETAPTARGGFSSFAQGSQCLSSDGLLEAGARPAGGGTHPPVLSGESNTGGKQAQHPHSLLPAFPQSMHHPWHTYNFWFICPFFDWSMKPGALQFCSLFYLWP